MAAWRAFLRWSWWLKAPAFLAVAVIILVIIGASLSSEDNGRDGDQSVVAGTTEIRPTSTSAIGAVETIKAEVTITQGIQTQEARPTEPPAPTSTPKVPIFSAAECDYLAAVSPVMDDVSGALVDISVLFGDAGNDPLLFFDETWRLDVVIALAVLNVSHDITATLTPPAALVQLHDTMMSALSQLRASTDLIATGIDNFDPDLLDRAGGLIVDATDDIAASTDLVVAFGMSRSGSC